MNKSEFMAWLEGFLYDKVRLGISEIELIQDKLMDATQETYSLGNYPNPYVCPGINNEGIKPSEVEFIKDNYEELFEKYANDVDIVSVQDEGMTLDNAFGEMMFLGWDEVKSFIEERMSYEKDN